MATVIAFAGSNSSRSINYQLVKYTAGLLDGHEVSLLDLAKHPYPMYSQDLESEQGFPEALVQLSEDLSNADALVLSVNEHNGNPSAYFKNVLDWLSRINRNFLEDTAVLLMSSSPGKRGGIGSLGVIENMLPRFGASIQATFSLPSFHGNFDADKGILDNDLAKQHHEAVHIFKSSLD